MVPEKTGGARCGKPHSEGGTRSTYTTPTSITGSLRTMIERPYEFADLPSVIETYTASIRSLAASHYSPEQIAAWAPVPADTGCWQERLAHLHTIVAESDGVLAGFASHTDDGYLDFLFTHPAFARRGVASGLLRRVESVLLALVIPRVTTHASLAARPARGNRKAETSGRHRANLSSDFDKPHMPTRRRKLKIKFGR